MAAQISLASVPTSWIGNLGYVGLLWLSEWEVRVEWVFHKINFWTPTYSGMHRNLNCLKLTLLQQLSYLWIPWYFLIFHILWQFALKFHDL